MTATLNPLPRSRLQSQWSALDPPLLGGLASAARVPLNKRPVTGGLRLAEERLPR
jgi:hypothetical protein